jgi:hypothetical protein
MREFNINEIEFEKDKVPTEKLLTGEYLKSLEPYSKMQPNAETEDGEYMKYPDKTVVKTISADHEEGGVKVSIPDGTTVISNALKPTKKQIKEIEKNYKITVSPSDTYAKLVEKFTNKIGLRKLNEEQEQLFKALKKEEEKQIPAATAKVNLEYLTGKIKNIEDKKQPLQEERQSFFDYVYNLQEATKPADEANPIMEYGGEFSQTAAKYGLTQDQAITMLRKGGYFHPSLPKYDEGGKQPPKFVYNYKTNTFQPETEEYQRATKEGAYGTFGTRERTLQGIQQLYNNFPDYVEDNFKEYINIDKSGKVSFKDGKALKLNEKQQIVGKLQEGMGNRYEANYKVITSDPNLTPEEKARALKWYEEEGFTHNRPIAENIVGKQVLDKLKSKGITTYGQLESKLRTPEIKNILKDVPKENAKTLEAYTVRNYDQKAGQFTLGRQSVGVDLVTPEDLKKLQDRGITTLKQLEKNPEILESLGEASKERVKAFQEQVVIGQPDADFFIDPIKVPEATPGATPGTGTQLDVEADKKPEAKVAEGTDVDDKVVSFLPPNQRPPRWFFTPDQTPLPPTPLEAVAMGDVRLGRIDPVRVGIEQQLAGAENQRRFVAQQLEAMPETQKASALALMLSNSDRNINQAQTQANQINAQNLASAEMFNIGQADKEAIYGLNNLLSYEQKTLLGKAKAEEQLRNFYTSLKKNNAINYRDTQKLNLLEGMFPEYNLDFSGMRVNFDPNNPNDPVIRDSFMGNYSKIFSTQAD